jgi:hypothetical protein
MPQQILHTEVENRQHHERTGSTQSSIECAALTQILKQQKTTKCKKKTTNLSILTLNINGLHTPIKRHHLANWIKKEDLINYCLQNIHLIDRKNH